MVSPIVIWVLIFQSIARVDIPHAVCGKIREKVVHLELVGSTENFKKDNWNFKKLNIQVTRSR